MISSLAVGLVVNSFLYLASIISEVRLFVLFPVLLAICLESISFILELFDAISLAFSVFCFSSLLISSFNFFFSVASFDLAISFLSIAIKSLTSLL